MMLPVNVCVWQKPLILLIKASLGLLDLLLRNYEISCWWSASFNKNRHAPAQEVLVLEEHAKELILVNVQGSAALI